MKALCANCTPFRQDTLTQTIIFILQLGQHWNIKYKNVIQSVFDQASTFASHLCTEFHYINVCYLDFDMFYLSVTL